MKEKRKIHQQSWFIMLLLFSPLFPIGFFLMWKEKGMHVGFKVFFTLVYIYAIVYTLQTQQVHFMPQKPVPTEQKEEVVKEDHSDVTIMVSYIAAQEDELGEYYQSEQVKDFNKEKYDSAYKVTTSIGEYLFYLKDNKVVEATEINKIQQ